MGKNQSEMTTRHIDFIRQQKIFFVGTAASDGRINVSPKGLDTLKIKGSQRVIWLNLTGSGNETAAHLLEKSRMTLMFCAFSENPLILRLYGYAKAIHPRDSEWQALLSDFPLTSGARQIVDMEIDLVQTSCGYGVPLLDFVGERDQLLLWSEGKGPEGIAQYWEKENQFNLDGKPTGIFERRQ